MGIPTSFAKTPVSPSTQQHRIRSFSNLHPVRSFKKSFSDWVLRFCVDEWPNLIEDTAFLKIRLISSFNAKI